MASDNGIVLETIKNSIYNIIEEEYKSYLETHKLLLIEKKELEKVVSDYYSTNSKTIKSKIRELLKEKFVNDYNSTLVENILLDIFQEKDINVLKIVNELDALQNKNLKEFVLPLINKSLNLNISLIDNYIIINSTNPKAITEYTSLYENISKYKFIYSINNDLLHKYENDEKINVIKKHLEENTTNTTNTTNTITIQCYYLKDETRT
jgi:hypothetical protein